MPALPQNILDSLECPRCGSEQLRLATCDHDFTPTTEPGGTGDGKSARRDKKAGKKRGGLQPGLCSKCDAWKGELGQEPDPWLFVDHVVEVFGHVHRVLHPSGVVWINVDDSYITNPHGPRSQADKDRKWPRNKPSRPGNFANRSGQTGIPGKNLALVPQRLMIALQEAGWIVRLDVIWSKGKSFDAGYVGSAMPESAHDRPARSHEYLIMLTKQPSYFWDDEAVREKATTAGQRHEGRSGGRDGNPGKRGFKKRVDSGTRKLRSVWELRNESSGLEHYAMFPRSLPNVCIRGGASEKGCCPACGWPWKRIVEKGEPNEAQIKACGANADGNYHGKDRASRDGTGAQSPADAKRNILKGMVERKTVGWEQTCSCDAGEPIPCVVFDPFLGSGTTILEAVSLGRDGIGIELLPNYAEMARNRIEIAARHGFRDLNIPRRAHEKQTELFGRDNA